MRRLFLALILSLISFGIFAQDDLMNIINQDSTREINYTTATFKSTRVMNGHSIERMVPGQLDVRISHRFGTLNSGGYNFFGLDQSNIHLGLEYGILKWLMIGVGRSEFEKTYDGFAKFSILRQSSGAKVMPVSVSAVTSIALKTLKFTDQTRTNYFTSRLAYVAQILVARKINEAFSVQLTPSYLHRNLVATELDPNDIYALGAGARLKLSKRISLNGEYYYIANPKTYMSQQIYNPLSLGFDIETGGHVFQLFFTNSLGMTEKQFIGATTGQWKKGDIHFGFNISRVFTLKKNKKPSNY
jgi:opacity protein-like surface antigen